MCSLPLVDRDAVLLPVGASSFGPFVPEIHHALTDPSHVIALSAPPSQSARPQSPFAPRPPPRPSGLPTFNQIQTRCKGAFKPPQCSTHISSRKSCRQVYVPPRLPIPKGSSSVLLCSSSSQTTRILHKGCFLCVCKPPDYQGQCRSQKKLLRALRSFPS